MSIADLPAIKPLFLFTALLWLKMFAVGFHTANVRRKVKIVINPEDAKVNPGSRAEPQEAPETMRCKRAHINDLENIPIFLFSALLFTLAGASAQAGWAYFGLFFAARLLHTVFYLNGVQPFRTMMFAIGVLTQLGLMVQLVMKALAMP